MTNPALLMSSPQGLPSSRLRLAPYFFALPLQRLKSGKHLSVPSEGRMVGVQGTLLRQGSLAPCASSSHGIYLLVSRAEGE